MSGATLRELRLGYSTCPNDTFIFYPLVSSKIACPVARFRPVLEDVETLNRWALERRLPVTKISFHAFGHLRESYVLLRSGAALGRGCGPLLVARDASVLDTLHSSRVAIPGEYTSAALLLRLYAPEVARERLVEMTFDRIFSSLLAGEVDAGLIIHESRFTYQQHGLVSLVDLGAWWEEEAGLPIPLGGIIADRRLGDEAISAVSDSLAESVRYARKYPEFCADYVRQHAQELSEEVTRAHVELYVNDFTADLGEEGRRALEVFFAEATARGILPAYDGSFIVD